MDQILNSNHNKSFFSKLKDSLIPRTFIKQRIFMILLVFFLCSMFAIPNARQNEVIHITPLKAQESQHILLQGDAFEQTFSFESDYFPSALGFEFLPEAKSDKPITTSRDYIPTSYSVKLLDQSNNVLNETQFSAFSLEDNILLLPMPEDLDVRGQTLTLQVRGIHVNRGEALTLVTEPTSQKIQASLSLNGQTLDNQQVPLSILYRFTSTSVYIITLLIFIASALCIWLWRNNLANNVLLVLLVFGLLFCFITPIFDVPDEPVHTAKSMMVGNGDFFRTTPNGNAISKSWFDLHDDFQKTLLDTNLHDQPINADLFYSQDGVSQLFLGYLPQGFAFAIANLFHLDILPAFYLGRILNMLFYAILAWLAVKHVKKFQLFFAAIALMPMCLYIASSYNPDAYIYGLCLLMAAYYINLYFDQSKVINWKQILIFTLLIILISIKKYNFAPFLLLLLFIPVERFASKKVKYLGFLLTLALVAVSVIAIFYALAQMELGTTAGSENSLVGEGTNALGANMGKQIQFVMQNKFAVANMFVKNIVESLGGFLVGMFTFGWLSYTVPTIVSLAWFVFIGLVAFFYSRSEFDTQKTLQQTRSPLAGRIGILFTMFLIAFLSYLMMYLGWTTVGAMTILGVQGRYFIPALFFLPLIGQNVFPLIPKTTYDRSRFNILFMSMLFLVVTLLTTVSIYY